MLCVQLGTSLELYLNYIESIYIKSRKFMQSFSEVYHNLNKANSLRFTRLKPPKVSWVEQKVQLIHQKRNWTNKADDVHAAIMILY